MKEMRQVLIDKRRGTRLASLAAIIVLLFAATSAPAWIETPAEDDTAWVCPMHSAYTTDIDGKCPICGMSLVRAAPYDVRDYRLDFTTVPATVRAGQDVKLIFRIAHPENGARITKFETVHDRQYHLFVISQDMEFFEHLHPEEASDGTWSIDVNLPKPGYYKVLSDFMPSGGAPQFLARPLVTVGYSGDIEADSAHLTPDSVLTKTDDDLTATVTFDPPEFVVGQYGHINFHLTDTATKRPITDLQTYLAAFGHTLMMSEDMVDYVHSHPVDPLARNNDDGSPPQFLIPPDADSATLEALRGGPDVTFEGLMPKPGNYRAWTQFRRNGKVHTFAFTFHVVPSAP